MCERHGRAGLADVCIHIGEAVSLRSRLNDVVSASFNMGNFANEEDAQMILVFTYCQPCAETYGFPERSCELPGANWDEMSTRGQFTGVCAECLNELSWLE